MSNRILKESICTSDTVDQLTWFEEVFFYRLIVNCDDYGRMDGRPKILRTRLFPLKEGITDKQVEAALNALRTAGIVEVYMYDDRPYLQLRTWGKHQQIRAKKSKYPQPNTSESIGNQLISDDCNCPRNPIQSNPNPRETESTTVDQLARDASTSVLVSLWEKHFGPDDAPETASELMRDFGYEMAYECIEEVGVRAPLKRPQVPSAYIREMCRNRTEARLKNQFTGGLP